MMHFGKMLLAILLVFASRTTFAQTPAPAAPAEAPLVEMAPQPVPEEARVMGHHGKVHASGRLIQGHVASPTVTLSSGSPILDRAAVAIAQGETFRSGSAPASDRNVTLEVDFENYRYDTLGSYSCRQIDLDTDWLLGRGVALRQTDFYALMTGFALIDAKMKFMRQPNAEAIWRSALDKCRNVPDSPFLATLMSVAKKGR